MAKIVAVTSVERTYLEARLASVLAALRDDEKLREDFLFFVRDRGGSISLTLDRLKTVWWPSRKSMYPGFFVLALADFGTAHGLYPPRAGKSKAKKTRPRE